MWKHTGGVWRCIAHGKFVCVPCRKICKHPTQGSKGDLYPAPAPVAVAEPQVLPLVDERAAEPVQDDPRPTTKLRAQRAGDVNLVCPHCQTPGWVTSRAVKSKEGISGGKATAAVATAGLSVLATGLSRKKHRTELHCAHCGMTWQV